LDVSCKVWQKNSETETRGSCWIYDNIGVAVRVVVLLAIVRALALLFNFLALILYRAPATSSSPSEVSLDMKESNEVAEPKKFQNKYKVAS